MKTYIALLRGINVSGHKLIKMDLLRKVLSGGDLINIRTYIQSGNIIFDSDINDIKKLELMIAAIIREAFNFEVPTTVISATELLRVIHNNPFESENDADAIQPYTAFLSEIPQADNLAVLQSIDFGIDRFIAIGTTIYIWYGDSAGKTKLSNAMIENRLKLKSTSRNWKTVLKLYEIAANTTK